MANNIPNNTIQTNDPTLDFMAGLDDPDKYVRVQNAPIFIPHERDAKDKDGNPIKIVITEQDLAPIANQINERETSYGVPPILTIGHRRQADPNFPEHLQPPIVGCVREAHVGYFGPQQKPAVLATLYYKKDAWEEAKEFPFRSVDFYPGSNKVTGVALLKRDPFLPMGVISYAADSEEGGLAKKIGDYWRQSRIEAAAKKSAAAPTVLAAKTPPKPPILSPGWKGWPKYFEREPTLQQRANMVPLTHFQGKEKPVEYAEESRQDRLRKMGKWGIAGGLGGGALGAGVSALVGSDPLKGAAIGAGLGAVGGSNLSVLASLSDAAFRENARNTGMEHVRDAAKAGARYSVNANRSIQGKVGPARQTSARSGSTNGVTDTTYPPINNQANPAQYSMTPDQVRSMAQRSQAIRGAKDAGKRFLDQSQLAGKAGLLPKPSVARSNGSIGATDLKYPPVHNDAAAGGEPSEPTAARAPKTGITIGGYRFAPGMHIPPKYVSMMTPEQKVGLETYGSSCAYGKFDGALRADKAQEYGIGTSLSSGLMNAGKSLIQNPAVKQGLIGSGVGAAIGGIHGAVKGGDPLEEAKMGAALGGLGGLVSGAGTIGARRMTPQSSIPNVLPSAPPSGPAGTLAGMSGGVPNVTGVPVVQGRRVSNSINPRNTAVLMQGKSGPATYGVGGALLNAGKSLAKSNTVRGAIGQGLAGGASGAIGAALPGIIEGKDKGEVIKDAARGAGWGTALGGLTGGVLGGVQDAWGGAKALGQYRLTRKPEAQPQPQPQPDSMRPPVIPNQAYAAKPKLMNGKLLGSIGGTLAGGALGSAAMPGVGTAVGGTAGGALGEQLGDMYDKGQLKFQKSDKPVVYEVQHAPAGGATLNGKNFIGGQFIPAKDMAKATDEEKKNLQLQHDEVTSKQKVKEEPSFKNLYGLKKRKTHEEEIPIKRLAHPELKSMVTGFISDAPPEFKGELTRHLNETLTGKIGDFISKATPEELYEINQQLVMKLPPGKGRGDRAPDEGIVLEGHEFGPGQYIPPSYIQRATPDQLDAIRGPGYGRSIVDGVAKGLSTLGVPMAPKDDRTSWQKHAPSWLGGLEDPSKHSYLEALKKYPKQKAAALAALVATIAAGSMLMKKAQTGSSGLGNLLNDITSRMKGGKKSGATADSEGAFGVSPGAMKTPPPGGETPPSPGTPPGGGAPPPSGPPGGGTPPPSGPPGGGQSPGGSSFDPSKMSKDVYDPSVFAKEEAQRTAGAAQSFHKQKAAQSSGTMKDFPPPYDPANVWSPGPTPSGVSPKPAMQPPVSPQRPPVSPPNGIPVPIPQATTLPVAGLAGKPSSSGLMVPPELVGAAMPQDFISGTPTPSNQVRRPAAMAPPFGVAAPQKGRAPTLRGRAQPGMPGRAGFRQSFGPSGGWVPGGGTFQSDESPLTFSTSEKVSESTGPTLDQIQYAADWARCIGARKKSVVPEWQRKFLR